MDYTRECNFTPEKDSDLIPCVVEQGADDNTCMKCDLHRLGKRVYEEVKAEETEDLFDNPEDEEIEQVIES